MLLSLWALLIHLLELDSHILGSSLNLADVFSSIGKVSGSEARRLFGCLVGVSHVRCSNTTRLKEMKISRLTHAPGCQGDGFLLLITL